MPQDQWAVVKSEPIPESGWQEVKGQPPEKAKSWLGTIEDWIPTITGGIGGALGSVPGAMLGGAAGEGIKQTIQHASEVPGAIVDVTRNLVHGTPEVRRATVSGAISGASEGAEQAAQSALIQGALEGLGSTLQAGAKPVATSVMRSSMRPGIKALEKTGELETAGIPKAVTAALEHGGSVTDTGVRTLVAARGEALAAKNQIVANLSGRVSPSSVEQLAQGYADGLLVKADKRAAQKVIDEFADQYVRDAATGQMKPWLDADVADMLKTQYRQNINFGKMSKPAAQARKVIASGLKKGMEALDATGKLASTNATYGSLDDAVQMAARANATWKNKPLAMRTLYAIAGKSPAVNSYLARGLYDQAAAVGKVPVAVLRLLGAMLSEDDSQ